MRLLESRALPEGGFPARGGEPFRSDATAWAILSLLSSQTAEPIAAALGLGILPTEGLIEVDFGDWQAQKIKGLARLKLWKVIQGAPSRARFPGGESFSEAQHRICRELDQLAREHDPKDIILCVSHSDPIKLAIAYYIGLPLDLFQRLHISPGSITIISIRDTGSLLFAMNVGPSNPGILKSS